MLSYHQPPCDSDLTEPGEWELVAESDRLLDDAQDLAKTGGDPAGHRGSLINLEALVGRQGVPSAPHAPLLGVLTGEFARISMRTVAKPAC